MDLRAMRWMNLQPLPSPLGGLFSTLAVEPPTIRHLDYKFHADVP